MVETYDVLILGAGPAGISAARSLVQEGVSTVVLEARTRVGGRAYTSDSLGVKVLLDHGAKWIHGGCDQNRMIQLWRETQSSWANESAHFRCSADTTDTKTPPRFDVPDMDTEYQVSTSVPSANMTKILLMRGQDVVSKEPAANSRRVAKQAFKDIIKATLKDPYRKVIDENCFNLETSSLLDILFRTQAEAGDKPNDVASFFRSHLLPQNEHVKSELSILKTSEERQNFLDEVMALFTIEIHTFFESWEGAPLHRISAKYGLEGTCLSGGNVIVPFGYGTLVERLAQPLLQDNRIRLGHKIISVASTQTSGDKPSIAVKCELEEGRTKEFHAFACIVALPLGVLRVSVDEGKKDPGIQFEPELPATLRKSIRTLGIAAQNKIEMVFSTCWWPETIGRFTIAPTHLRQSPTYHPYTTFIVESAVSVDDKDRPNILVCYVTGDFARETEHKSDSEIQEEVMAVLRQADLNKKNNLEIPNPIAIHVTRWLSDPYSHGSWTFYGKGSSPQDVRNFRDNKDCQTRGIFFAGEHTCDGSIPGDDMGCVHGAWVSGELASKAALNLIRRTCE